MLIRLTKENSYASFPAGTNVKYQGALSRIHITKQRRLANLLSGKLMQVLGHHNTYYFPPICNMEGKSSTQTTFFYVYLTIVRGQLSKCPDFEFDFFSPKYSRFAVECD